MRRRRSTRFGRFTSVKAPAILGQTFSARLGEAATVARNGIRPVAHRSSAVLGFRHGSGPGRSGTLDGTGTPMASQQGSADRRQAGFGPASSQGETMELLKATPGYRGDR